MKCICGKKFAPKSVVHKFCSGRCRNKAWWKRLKVRLQHYGRFDVLKDDKEYAAKGYSETPDRS